MSGRKYCTVLLLLLFLAGVSMKVEAYEEERSPEMEELLTQFDFSKMDQSLSELFPEEKLRFQDVLDLVLSGEQELSGSLVNRLIKDQVGYAYRSCRDNLIHILVIALVAAVFHQLAGALKSTQIAEIGFYVLYLLLVALSLNSFGVVVEWAAESLEDLTGFMGVFCPLYFLAVTIAKGSVTSAAFYQIVLFLIFLVEVLIAKILLPLIHVYMMMNILNHLSNEAYLSRFSKLIETVVSWALKTLLACVVGINVIQGMISPAIDSVKQSVITRGAEAIPGVGDALGGIAEVALGTAVLIKNGMGMAGAVFCILICLVPIIQTALIAFLYQLAAAVIQPVCDPRIAGCIESVSEGCRLMLKVISTTALLFLLTIAIVTAVTSMG